MYQRNCENPPVHRDVPPISGRISWARQLMRRIRNPMDIFERHPSCLKTQEAIKVICNFNQLAAVLVEFEILYHKGWLKQVEIAKTGIYLHCIRSCYVLVTFVVRLASQKIVRGCEDAGCCDF